MKNFSEKGQHALKSGISLDAHPYLIDGSGDSSQMRTVPLTPNPDRRATGRHLVKWRAKVYLDRGLLYEGVTHDLSESGTAIFMDHNLRCGRIVATVHLAIPAAAGVKAQTVQAKARPVYSILDSRQKQFRVAFEFLSFSQGKEAMLMRLALSGCDVSHI